MGRRRKCFCSQVLQGWVADLPHGSNTGGARYTRWSRPLVDASYGLIGKRAAFETIFFGVAFSLSLSLSLFVSLSGKHSSCVLLSRIALAQVASLSIPASGSVMRPSARASWAICRGPTSTLRARYWVRVRAGRGQRSVIVR